MTVDTLFSAERASQKLRRNQDHECEKDAKDTLPAHKVESLLTTGARQYVLFEDSMRRVEELASKERKHTDNDRSLIAVVFNGRLGIIDFLCVPDVLKADKEEPHYDDEDGDVLDRQVALAHDGDGKEHDEGHAEHLHYLVRASSDQGKACEIEERADSVKEGRCGEHQRVELVPLVMCGGHWILR